jgi:AraC-like DNA-binding protein
VTATKHEPAVSAEYASSLFEFPGARGLPGRSRSDAPIPLDEWLALLESAMRETGDPDLALKIGESFKVKHLGRVGYVLMTCSTLGEVVAQAKRYNRLVGGVGGTRLVRRGKSAELQQEWTSGTPPPAIERIFAAATASLARWLSDRPDLRFGVWFRCARPADLTYHERLFGGELRFGAREMKLVFPAWYLDLPVALANPEIHSLVVAQADALLGGPAESEFLATVKAAITRDLATNRVSLASVARALATSTRTLHRRLEERGRSFRDVMNEVRRARAEAYLRSPAISLAEVAFLLGYSEQSTFQHAFKRWSGETPGDFRARNLNR